jgi:hypothetical protein
MLGVTAYVFATDIPSRVHLHLHIQRPRTEGMSPWTISLLLWRFIHSLIVFTFLQRCLFWLKGWMSSYMGPKTLTKCTSSIIVIDFASVVPSIEAHLVYTLYVKFLTVRCSSLSGRRHLHFKWSPNIHIEIKSTSNWGVFNTLLVKYFVERIVYSSKTIHLFSCIL